MKYFLFISLMLNISVAFTQVRNMAIRRDIPLDSIRLSDPFILADKKTTTYYMTGTGGNIWKSRDLEKWTGPFKVANTDSASWMGPSPMIWAAELHEYNGRYYYFATFTNSKVFIDTVNGTPIERRACHILVSDHPDGPYIPMKDPAYLPAGMPTLDATLWVEDGKPFMIFCHEWLQNLNGTIEKIALKPDLSGSTGDQQLLFRASDSPWSREKNEKGELVPNKVTDGPWLFRTKTGKLGMLWTSWIFDVYTQGVAYSSSGKLDGPWVHEAKSFTAANYGHGMMFRSFNGELLLSMHSHAVAKDGRYVRIPKLFKVDDSGDKLVLGAEYYPGE